MLHHRQLGQYDLEACGVLLGRFLVVGERVVIDAVTEPLPTDRRTRTTFVRSSAHQPLVEAAFRGSGGTQVYAGEWHTHPEALPTPSSQDLTAWREKLLDERVIVETLFFVIVGTRHLNVWEGSRHTGQIEKLTRLEYSEPNGTSRLERNAHARAQQDTQEPECSTLEAAATSFGEESVTQD
ncbi:MAG: Mov34/MPN/PAD-1 family protein [Meiothermus sp.]|nr:Mov34/MPN/PAD-1 family protein [Meiothermus sp.]